MYFTNKSEVKVVDSRRMKTDFSQYPQGKRTYLIPDWEICDPYQVIPNNTQLVGKETISEPAL